jgi:N-acetyltransferase
MKNQLSDLVDLDAYFQRIGYKGDRTPTLATLQAIRQRHTTAIAFENLNPFLHRPVFIDLEAVQQKLIHNPRGGYCFEQNMLLRAVLIALGFRVSNLAARIVSSMELNPFSATHQGQANLMVFLSVVKDPSVVICTRGSEAFYRLLLQLGSFAVCRDSGTDSNRKVSTQPKQPTNVLINQGLNRMFIGQLCINFLVDIVTSVSKSLKCFINFDDLSRSRLKPTNYGESLFQTIILLSG